MSAEREQTLADIERLKAAAAHLEKISDELEEMARGYREKADQLLRDAAHFRIAATRMLSKLAAE